MFLIKRNILRQLWTKGKADTVSGQREHLVSVECPLSWICPPNFHSHWWQHSPQPPKGRQLSVVKIISSVIIRRRKIKGRYHRHEISCRVLGKEKMVNNTKLGWGKLHLFIKLWMYTNSHCKKVTMESTIAFLKFITHVLLE